jgi:membrane associated rhomboid family serine protease
VIPLKTVSPVFRAPVMTWLIIAVNVGAFLWMESSGSRRFDRVVYEYSAVPQNVVGADVRYLMLENGLPLAIMTEESEVYPFPGREEIFRRADLRKYETGSGLRYTYRGHPVVEVTQRVHPWLTVLTAMFMHAGWLHLIFNMWALLVFGPNVEDTLGRIGFLVFYLACGVAATAAQIIHDPHSVIPTLGASGAIAGVMGGLAVRFPGAQVLTLIPIILYTVAQLPVWVFMLIYLGEQIFMSLQHSEANGGVAWWAHIGGFAAGYLLIRFFPVAKGWKAVFSRPRSTPFA